MANAGLDQNSRQTLTALSSANDGTIVALWADPTTHALLVDGSGGTVSLTVGTTTIASGTTTRVLYDNAGVLGEYTISGSGSVAMTTSPTFVTPTLGAASVDSLQATGASSGVLIKNNSGTTVASFGVGGASSTNIALIGATAVTGALTATTFQGLTITSTTGTLTITNGKTLSVSNTLTLAGTDSTVMTFPSTSATIARTDAAQTFTGTQTFSQIVTTNNAITAVANAATIPITSRISTVTNNSAATLTITMTTTSAVDGQQVMVRILDASAVAQTITWVNTEDSTVTAPTTSNGSTTLPLTVGFQFNAATTKWRCIGKA